jgi:hypothetical protein
MKQELRWILFLSLIAFFLSACASVEFSDQHGNPVTPSGRELCSTTRLALQEPRTLGSITPDIARELVTEAIIKADAGLRVVSVGENPDALIDIWITDATECVHCPEDHNYLSWSLIIFRASDNAFLANIHHDGWKLTSSTPAITRGLRALRSSCS